MKKAFVAILSLAALVACSQDVTVKRNDSAAIGFDNSFVENKTRAAADPSKTTATLEEFAVWGFYNDPDGSENFLVFDNEVVTKTTEGWSYKNLQYWMKGFDYFFGAVSPVNRDDIITVDTRTMSEDGLGKISFTNTDGSVDLLYAFEDVYNGEINVSAPEKVRFQFAHLLSRVKFSFKYNFPNELTTVAVENIKINNSPAEGSIDVTKARANWSWDITQNSKNVVLDFGHVNGAEQFAELDTPYESDKYRLMIPTDESRPLNITFDIVFYQNGERAYTYSKEANLAKTFVQGKSYNIVAEITPKELELQPIVFDVIVLDWDVENDVLISPEDSDQPGDDNDDPEAFEPVASEWGVVGDLTNWGSSSDIVMYTTPTENLFVAEKVEIKSGAFKIRANGKWDDAKNYGFEVAGKAYADKYYAVITGSGSQNITPIEPGVYDVYFDLAQKRVALMTPGKAYAEAEDGGAPVVVIEGLKDHEWGLVGSFNNWDVANYVVTTVEGDWAVAKNIALAKNAEFKFAADKAWTLSYGTACDVKVGETYQAKNNAGNMKYVGEAGNFDFYFSLVDAKFYMTVAGAEAPAEPVALATPVVEASVEGNVVTLNWAVVENAAQYSITVGTETPVFVEETTYVFTGEYETEYTFNVVAVPADEEKFAASEAAVVTVTTEEEKAIEPEELIALDADCYYIFKPATEIKGGKWYALVYDTKAATGLPSNYGYLKTTTALARTEGISLPATCAFGFLTTDGGFTIQQFDGKYVYQSGEYDSFNVAATAPEGGHVWSVGENGITNNVTSKFVQYDSAYGTYGCYATAKGNIPAYYEMVEVDSTPVIVDLSASSLSFGQDAESKVVEVAIYGSATLSASASETWVSAEVSGNTITVSVEANEGEAREVAVTINYGNDSRTVTVSQAGAGASDTKGTYTSEDFLKGGTSTGGKYYLEKVNVGGTSYDCLKLGTSSVVGDYTTKAVNEAGDLTLSFYAVGWNGKTSKLNVYVDGVKVGETLTLTANSGAANNSPYTITPSDDKDYYSISLTGVTESSKIKFETVSGATRAIIFGVQLY